MAEVGYVEVPDDVRVARLEARHHAFGKSREDARRWARGSDQAYAELIEATRAAADLVVAWRS